MLHRTMLVCTILLLCTTVCSAMGPYREEFKGGKASPQWRVHCSAGNTIDAHDGYAEINADLNTYAHLSTNLGIDGWDCLTISARIKPSPNAGVTWCTSVFLVWPNDDWCQMGMISAPNGGGGRFYAVETIGGSTVETYLSECDLTKWHYVRIQLGEDCIRYYSSEDGRHWKCLRVIERPMGGMPAGAIVGKGYGTGKEPYAACDLDNDYADRGPRVVSSIADIRLENTPDSQLHLTKAEREALDEADLDPVGTVELARKGDTTYERVAKYYPPMKYPKEAVGVPEHPVDICVDHFGRLQLNYNTPLVARFEVDGIPFGDEKAPITRRLLDGWIPAVTLNTEHDGLKFQETVFGWSEEFSPDTPLFAYVRLRAKGKDLPRKVMLVSDSTGKRTEFPMIGGEVCIRMPFPSCETPVAITSGEYDRALKQYADSWRKVVAAGERIEVPEKRVNEAYRAWIAYSLLDVDKVDGYCEPHDGTGFYEEIYGYSAALYCILLDMYGMHDQAERYLDTLMHFQQPDGLYTQNFGLPDTGGLLLALAEHYNYTGDKDWLRRVSGNMVRAGEWLIRRRNEAPRTGVTRGLIKFRAYCDYAEPVYDYYADSYCAVGMAKAAEALEALGMKDEARKFREEAVRYRADILASMESAVIEKDGMKMLPLEPETHRLLQDSHFTGGDYYGLVASSMLENELLPADDKRAWWVTDLMEQKQGLIAGVCKFQPGGIDHAYTFGYLLTQLKRNDARKVILGFYGMLAYGMTRDTYSGVECTNAVTGNNYWTLPHLYSNMQQLKLLRMMLLREDGDSLFIGDAIPRAWLEDGKVIRMEKAPTRFGEVSFKITSHVASGTIDVELTPPTRQPAHRIRIRLRHPNEAPIRSITVDGRRYQRFAGETIELRGLTKPVRVQVKYQGASGQ